MASRLSPLGIITKWLLVPGALAAIGYYFIGPRVGDKVIPAGVKNKVQAVTGQSPTSSSTTELPRDATSLDDDVPTKTYKEPEVDVSVAPLQNTSSTTKKKKRRRKRKPPVTATPNAPAPPVGDPAGTGGMTEPPPADGGGTNG